MADQLVPNYTTINPDGTVGASFTGTISALGLSLPESTGATVQFPNALEWLAANGIPTAVLEGQSVFGGHRLVVQSRNPPSASDFVELDLEAVGGLGGSSISVNAEDSAGGSQGPKIIDSAGNSTFLQLVTDGRVRAQLDVLSGTFVGGTGQSSQAFANGLAGISSAYYFATPIDPGGGTGLAAQIRVPTVAGCTVVISSIFGSPPAATPWQCYLLGLYAS